MNACFFGVMFLASAACEGGPTASAEEMSDRYETRGEVRGIDAEGRSITIAHEDVPGYMPAMTMPFAIDDMSLVEGITVGDRVRFSFEPQSGGRHVLVAIEKLGPTEGSLL